VFDGQAERVELPDGVEAHHLVAVHDLAHQVLAAIGVERPTDHDLSLIVYAALTARLRKGGIN
jgi:hypothetical protein